jgi:diguanylate cyclase (GGDEF)-like protein/PAS domain S-box-containing protein
VGSVRRAGEHPAYFEALLEEEDEILAAGDALADPRTAGLAADYLDPHGVGAVLDAPLRRDGQTVGMVGHEHVGPSRDWTDRDRDRAALSAELVALTLEARARREVQEKYRNLFDLSLDMVFLLDAGDGRILEANRLARERLGYAEGELEGASYRTLHPDDALPGGEGAFRETVETGTTRFLSAFRTSGGEEFPVEISARRLELGGQTVVQAVARDMSDWIEARERIRASERRYRQLFERNVAGVFRTTPGGEILEVNGAFARILGYESPEEVLASVERVDDLFVDPREREGLLSRLESQGSAENFELRLRRKDGTAVWVLENSALLEGREDGGDVIEGTLVNVTERKRLRQELEELAYHDTLTGAANRRLLKLRAEKTLARARREESRAGLIYLDLVRFKRINDTLGHAAGDRALTEAAERLRSVARESDTVARVGGDEFAVLLAEVDRPEGARRAAERMAEALAPPMALGERGVHLEARLGVALFPEHADDADGLLSAADAAIYQSGPVRAPGIHVYREPDPEEQPPEELPLEEGIREALAEDRLLLYLQPVVRSGDGRTEGAEALVRWDHPERGILAAEAFIHLAERSSVIHELDRWALSAALDRVAALEDAAGGPDWISVNLSAASLRDPSLAEHVAGELEARGLDPSRLVMEVTEHTAMRIPGPAAEILENLRSLGVGIAIDDFGTGHAALAYLERFPADLLKMDGVFLESLDREADGREPLAAAILRLGHAVGMRVVAEHVETDAQRRWLEAAGFDLLQGFGVGEPAPA